MSIRRVRTAHLVAVAALAVGAVACTRSRPAAAEPRSIPGMVRQTEVRVAPEISGRLVSIAVSPGQHVKQGDLLAIIDNPDLTAGLAEATAASGSAAAERMRVYSGTRPQQVSIGAEAVQTAEANLLLARQQHDRAATLNSKSFLSQQQLDDSTASLAKAQADLEGKQAQNAAERAGPTAEERRLADARAMLAKAAVASLEAQVAKTKLLASADGTIGVRVSEIGEIMAPGKPVLTLNLDGRRWFAFTLREDQLRGLSIGSVAQLIADNGRSFDARVSELRPLGEFATWRAARAVGDHDLNSFSHAPGPGRRRWPARTRHDGVAADRRMNVRR